MQVTLLTTYRIAYGAAQGRSFPHCLSTETPDCVGCVNEPWVEWDPCLAQSLIELEGRPYWSPRGHRQVRPPTNPSTRISAHCAGPIPAPVEGLWPHIMGHWVLGTSPRWGSKVSTLPEMVLLMAVWASRLYEHLRRNFHYVTYITL